jgi:hypothetical protein
MIGIKVLSFDAGEAPGRSTSSLEPMRVLCLVLAFLPFAAQADGGSHLAIGPLNLQLSPGWRTTGNAQHVESHGPDGQTIIATYAAIVSGSVSDPTSKVLETARGFARDRMPGLAEKNGKVQRPVTESSLADSRVEFSAASAGKRMFRDYYFIQYLIAGKRGMVYLTVEGYGDAAKAASSFDDILAAQQWIE